MTTEESFTISDIKVEGETIHKIKYNSSTIHLLGTSHLNPRYILLVNELINKTAPQVVGVELCRTRVGHRNSINERGGKPTEFVFNKIPSHMLHAAVGEKLRLTYVYGAVQYEESKEFRVNLMRYKRMRTFKLQTPTKVGKLYIGAEIMEPFKNQIWHADSMESKYLSNSYTNYKILLLDRPVEKTFSDMAEALKKEEKDKIKFYKNYFEDVFLKANVMNSTHLMDNLWAKNTKIRKIFMDDRDRFMAKVIFKAVTKDQIENIVCVIGRSHIEGVLKHLQKFVYQKEFA